MKLKKYNWGDYFIINAIKMLLRGGMIQIEIAPILLTMMNSNHITLTALGSIKKNKVTDETIYRE